MGMLLQSKTLLRVPITVLFLSRDKLLRKNLTLVPKPTCTSNSIVATYNKSVNKYVISIKLSLQLWKKHIFKN